MSVESTKDLKKSEKSINLNSKKTNKRNEDIQSYIASLELGINKYSLEVGKKNDGIIDKREILWREQKMRRCKVFILYRLHSQNLKSI